MAKMDELFAADEVQENVHGSLHSNITGTTIDSKRGLDVTNINQSEESVGNSSSTPLTSGSTFTGTGEQNAHPHVGIMVKTDQPGTLFFDFSGDGSNWDSTFPVVGFSVAANIPEFHTAVKLKRYFRVRFVNGTDGDQTFFRLFTYYGDNYVPSNAPLNQQVSIDQDALITRHTIAEDEIIRGLRAGTTPFTKFAYRTGLTASSGEQTIWAAPGNFTPMSTASTFTITYNSSTDGLGTTGALNLYFQYIDADGLAQAATHILSNTGSDVTSFTGLGINRVAIGSSGSATYNTNDITITETTGGTTQAFIPATQSVTQQAIYFTDSNSFAVGKFIWINANKLSGGASPRVEVKGYVYSRVSASRYEIFRYTIDTGSENTMQLVEPVGFKLNATDVLYFIADTDTNSTTVNLRFSLIEYKND